MWDCSMQNFLSKWNAVLKLRVHGKIKKGPSSNQLKIKT
jgi:hypothetical protein